MTAGRAGLWRADLAFVGLALAVTGAIAWSVLRAPAPSLDARTRELESRIRCPVCQGLSIADSPALLAQQMRTVVREQLASGATDSAVLAYFMARYGEWILLEPSPDGPGTLLWLAPAALLLAGGALVALRAARPATPPTGGADAGSELDGLPLRSPGRLARPLIGVAMALVVIVPVALAAGPRMPGTQITGQAPPSGAPTIADLEALVRAAPRDAGAEVALGDAYMAADRVADAATAYRQALVIEPTNVEALVQLGLILLMSNRPDAAGPLFDRALAVAPDNPDALLYRALARARSDGLVTAAARADLERFLAVAPADPRRQLAQTMLSAPEGSTTPTP